jgi:hypothetical protein
MNADKRGLRKSWLSAFVFAAVALAQTSPKITTPKQALGFNVGDDTTLRITHSSKLT